MRRMLLLCERYGVGKKGVLKKILGTKKERESRRMDNGQSNSNEMRFG